MYAAIESYRFKVFRYIFLVIFSLFAIGPSIWFFLSTVKTEVDLFTRPPLIFFKPTLINYSHVITVGQFHLYFLNSIIIALFGTFISVIVGGIGAYSLIRGRYRGKQAVSSFVLLFRMIPAIAIVIPIYLVARQFRLTNTKIVLILAYTAFNLPFVTWMMRGYIATIPLEMEEAAMIDGASKLDILVRIVFPVSLPGLFSTAIFCFLLCWNEFVVALSLTSTARAQTLPVYVLKFITPQGLIWGYLSTASFLMLLPALAFGLFAQRYIIEGLRAGITK